MLKHYTFENIHYWQVARSYFGYSLYVTGFFLVDRTLIDCGPRNARSILASVFGDMDCEKILITHHHEDHTGNLDLLKRPAFGHSHATEALKQVAREIPPYRRIVWGRPKESKILPLPGPIITGKHHLVPVETPGHSSDHVCFFDPDRYWLFTGDLYLASYLRYLRRDEDIFLIMDSLRRLIALKPKVIFCNHRGFVEKATEAFSKKLEFLENIQQAVEEGWRQGESEERMAARLFKSDRWMKYFSAGEFSSLNLVRAFVRPLSGQKNFLG